MWADAQRWFDVHRDALARAGVPLAARLEPDQGLLCSYAAGVVRLALPDPVLPGGALRAGLLAALLRLDVERVVWLFRALLPRLVAHEIGHALRAEAGRRDPDPWREEQAAERLACLLARPHLAPATRDALLELLAPIARALGGLGEALGSYRLAARACAHPGLADATPAAAPPLARYGELATFLRVSVAWTYFDLLLDPEDTLDAFRRDLLLAG